MALSSARPVTSTDRAVPVATISQHPGFSSIGFSTARQVSIAGMTQPISAQAIGPRPDSSGGCHADVA
jgi:hypothetical protein